MNDTEIQKYAYIDALRGIAIIGVVLAHTSQWVTPPSAFLSKFALEGARGVQLFYIASALTLFLSMASRRQHEKKSTLAFFIRRFFRIAPAFYCAIIVYTAYYGMSARYWAPNGLEWWYIPITAIFLHGWHPETITSVVPGGWSIAVEMTFYLFVPYLFLKLKNIKATLTALIISIIVSRTISIPINYLMASYYPESQQYLVSSYTHLWFFSQAPVFISGILLYHIINQYPHSNKQVASHILITAVFLFIAFLTVQTYRNLLPKHILYGFVLALFSLSLHYHPYKFFVNKLTILMGRLSFSIYLVHFMVLNIMEEVITDKYLIQGNIGFLLEFFLVITLSTCISFITYKLIELPGIRLGKQIVQKI